MRKNEITIIVAYFSLCQSRTTKYLIRIFGRFSGLASWRCTFRKYLELRLLAPYNLIKKHSNTEYYCASVTDKVRMSNSFIEDCKKIVALKE